MNSYYEDWHTTDRIKRLLRKVTGKTKPTDQQIALMSVAWGIYVGEVLRCKIGDRCIWSFGSEKEKQLWLQCGEIRLNPIDLVYNRLINGPTDNVRSAYEKSLVRMR